MKQLPTETLHEIFVSLNQVDKLECMLVYRHWERVIRTLSLFHTVQLYSKNAVKKITKKLQQEQYQGAKVKRLIIDFSDYDESVDLNALLSLLPNLQEFVRSANLGKFTIEDDNLQDHPLYTIYSLSICISLESLYINFDIKEVITLLQNAPVLRSLTVVSAQIAVEDLELLHACTPSLETFRFIRIEVESFYFEGVVRSATSICNCIFDNVVVNNIKNEIYLLQYVSTKYSSLLNFKYINKYEYMNSTHISETDVFNLFNHGWYLLFQGLGSQLKTLSLGKIVRPGYLVEGLDNAGCQITYLKLKSLSRSVLKRLAQSNQARHIQVLRLEDVRIDNFEFLNKFISLRKLKVATSLLKKPLEVDLNNILKNCTPTLHSLSFKGVTVGLQFDDIPWTCITKLSFSSTSLPLKIDTFISKYIPKLSILKLVGCCLQGRSFNLPLIDLSYCHIEDIFPNFVRGIAISTSRNNEHRYITVKDIQPNLEMLEKYSTLDAPFFPVLKSQPLNENNGTPFLTITCNSLNNLVALDIW